MDFRQLILLILPLMICIAPAQGKNTLGDGIYLVDRSGRSSQSIKPLQEGDLILQIHRFFKKLRKKYDNRYVINGITPVPLHLRAFPDAKMEVGSRTTLVLALADEPTRLLRELTERHTGKMAVVVIKGKVVAIIPINEPITDGKVMIPDCTDKAGEFIYYELKEEIKKSRLQAG